MSMSAPMDPMMSSPLAEFDSTINSSEVTFIVYYRGHWCPFCRAYLRTLQTLSTSNSNLTVLAITAEPESFLSETRESTGYTGIVIVDTQHEIAKELKKRNVVNVAITERKGYEFGLAQPAVVVLKKGGEVLESWAIVPSLMNLGGASDRPNLEQVWENAQAKLNGEKMVHKTYKKLSALSVALGKA